MVHGTVVVMDYKVQWTTTIIDDFPFYESIGILQKSITEFNNQNLEFYFNLIHEKFKIKVFVQSFSCDNPRTMGILNLSMGQANIFCRSCITPRSAPYELKRLRLWKDHNEVIENIKIGEILESDAMAEQGIKYIHDLDLSKFEFFKPFHDFPFDILHSVYLGLIKHALTETFKSFDAEKKEKFITYYKQLNTSGIEYLPKQNIIAYVQSMTGKDFKAISKVIYNCLQVVEVSNDMLNSWNRICYITKFVNLKSMSDKIFRNFIDNIKTTISGIGTTFPILSTSVKLHLCLHIENNINRHGIPLGYSTEVFESFNKVLREYISNTNQHNFANDALIKFYQSFRADFISRNSNYNIHSSGISNNNIAKEKPDLKFSRKIFNGFYNEFIKIDKFDENETLKQSLKNCPGKFDIFESIEGQAADRLFLKHKGNFYQFVLGVEITRQGIIGSFFLGKQMELNKQTNSYKILSFQRIEEFKGVELVNFQHACKELNCMLGRTRISHTNVDQYVLNKYIF